MIDDMGVFRTTIGISHAARPGDRRELAEVMVDTGSEYNWIPGALLDELGIEAIRTDRFETADGRVLERAVGFALVSAGGRTMGSVVVFGQPGDMVLLGAIGLESLNLKVDLGRKELVPAGPVPAAAGGIPSLKRGSAHLATRKQWSRCSNHSGSRPTSAASSNSATRSMTSG